MAEQTLFEIINPDVHTSVIKVIGVGGCGGNAVDHMIASGLRGVEFICANTDYQALRRTSATNVVQLGATLTRGLGAGADPEVGRKAAQEDREAIANAISGANMLFITAGMGGGTGTGAAPVVAEIAREMGILSVAVVTKPFEFERKRTKVAFDGIEALKAHVDSLIVVPNNKLLQVLGGDVSVVEAYRAANNVLHGAVSGIAEIINCPGEVNTDFNDVKTIMSDRGMAVMGTAEASGVDRARLAAEQAVSCPLLDDINLEGALGVVVNITSSPSFKMKEFNEVMEIISGFTDSEAQVIYGHVIDEAMEDRLRVTIVATGFGRQAKNTSKQPLQIIRTGTDNAPVESDYRNLDEPAVTRRRNRNMVSSSDSLEIPAFLRRQAD